MKINYYIQLEVETADDASVEVKASGIATALQEGMESNIGEGETLTYTMMKADVRQEFDLTPKEVEETYHA